MKVYFNWLGEWIELNNSDTICGCPAVKFVTDKAHDIEFDSKLLSNRVEIHHKSDSYFVDFSLIAWTDKEN